MKKACAIAALMVVEGVFPVFASYASEPDELDIPRLVPHRDQEVRAMVLAERSKIVISSLKIPSLQEYHLALLCSFVYSVACGRAISPGTSVLLS
jgi:hypothetical protein